MDPVAGLWWTFLFRNGEGVQSDSGRPGAGVEFAVHCDGPQLVVVLVCIPVFSGSDVPVLYVDRDRHPSGGGLSAFKDPADGFEAAVQAVTNGCSPDGARGASEGSSEGGCGLGRLEG